jgi:hypothetical protein
MPDNTPVTEPATAPKKNWEVATTSIPQKKKKKKPPRKSGTKKRG